MFQAGGSSLCEGADVAEKYQFVNSQFANFSFNWMANKLEVSCSGYYAWLHRQDNPGPRVEEEETIAKAIDPIFTEHKERFGSFRIHQELRGQGFGISRNREARIMKKKGMKAKFRKRFKRTKSSRIQAIAANVLHR